MLHIVQVVLAGSAETPRVFADEAAAQAAFVECAKKYWAQSYAAWCERNGVDGGSFGVAQGFVASFDLADRSRVHYWAVSPEDAGDDVLPAQRARIEQLAREVAEAAGAVRKGAEELLAAVAGSGGDDSARSSQPAPPARDVNKPGRLAAAEMPAPAAPPDAAPPSARKRDTAAWKTYVQSIMNMCGGSREEFHLFNRHDWRQAVYGNETGLEYWEWVAEQVDDHIEKARQAGYTVLEDQGSYRYRAPDGTVGDAADEMEDEAWCRAGLHLEGK